MSILDFEEFKSLAHDTIFIDNWLQKIIYIDNDFSYCKNNDFQLQTILLKSGKLIDNCFKLVELKEVLTERSFSFLSENYLKSVEAFTFFSNQLLLYFDRNSPAKDDSTKAIFKYQDINFNTHLAEVEKITGLKAKIFDSHNVIQEVKETSIFKRFSNNLPTTEKHFIDFISNGRNSEIEESKNSLTTNKSIPVKQLRDFIKKNKKLEIEDFIKNHFSDFRAINLRYLIEFLVEVNILTILPSEKTKVYQSFKYLFEYKDIGSRNSIFDIKIDIENDIKYKLAKDKFLVLFKHFLE